MGGLVAIAGRCIGAVFPVQPYDEQDAEAYDDYERDRLERHGGYPLFASGGAIREGCRLPSNDYQKKDGSLVDSPLNRSEQRNFANVTFPPRGGGQT